MIHFVDWILFQALACEDTGSGRWGSGRTCWDETYYTTDAFRSPPKLLLSQTSSCLFAKSSKTFTPGKTVSNKRIFCIAFDLSQKGKAGGGYHSIKESRLFSSDNWFEGVGAGTYVDLGIGKRAQGVVGLGVVSKFIVVALRVNDLGSKRATAGGGDPMHLYVSTDGENWKLARFPHSAMPNLKEKLVLVSARRRCAS